MKKTNFFTGLLMIAVLLAVGCDKEECDDPKDMECPNYDPCIHAMETTAEFTIAQQYADSGNLSKTFINDDIVTGGDLRFNAVPQQNVVYTWVILGDTIVTEDPYVTVPIDNLNLGTYENSLTVTRTSEDLCFPNHSGSDQYSRSFTKIDGCDRAVLGRYRGLIRDSDADSLEIELISSSSMNEIQPCNESSDAGAIFAVNLNGKGETIKLNTSGYVNSMIRFENLGNMDIPEGSFYYNKSTDQAIAVYIIDGIGHTFLGRKLE